MADSWGGSWGQSWGVSWGSDAHQRPAGRPSKGRPPKKKRYELPNGLHVFGTAEEIIALAEQLVDEPVVLRVEKPVYRVTVKADDGAKVEAKAVYPVERLVVLTPQDNFDSLVAYTQTAPDYDIAVENILKQIEQRRIRRKRAFALLMSM